MTTTAPRTVQQSGPTTGPAAFEFPGDVYEAIRADLRDIAAETAFLAALLPGRAEGAGTPSGGRVLDLGCGTGTTLRALAALGVDGTGVDPSAAFVGHARAASAAEPAPGCIDWVLDRAETYQADGDFDLVCCLFATLNCLPRAELGGVLARVATWLRPGGKVVLEPAQLLSFVDAFQPVVVQHHRRDSLLVTRLARQIVYPHSASWRNDETLLVREPDGVIRMYDNVVDQAILTAPEMRDLLASAGLTVVATYGGFRSEPPPGHGRGPLIWVAERDGWLS